MPDLIYIIVIFALGAALVYLWRNSKGGEESSAFLMMQNQLKELREMLDKKLGESTHHMEEAVKHQFSESQKLIREITKELTEVKESSKQVMGITEQLQSLEQVLKNQKQRGSLGEAGLELILSNILPPSAYKMQYSFKDGDIVDAIIMTKDGIISVDAKFSLDNYTRLINEKDEEKKAQLERDFKKDLKRRIDETAKYIKPKEGTLPFAFMYIPAEGIYYDLLINEVGAVKVNTRSLIDYAYQDKNVVIVSPTTFSAYLQSVLYGFRAFKVEESAKDIIKRVEQLSRHLLSYEEYLKKLGNALGTTVNHYNTAYRELKKIDKDILRIAETPTGIEPITIDKPTMEEE